MKETGKATHAYQDLVTSLLKKNQTVKLVLRGGSMCYSIPPGSEIIVAPIDILYPGGIYVYHVGQDLVAHRLIRILPGFCNFRGERSDAGIEEIPEVDVIGKVVEIRESGRVLRTGSLSFRILSFCWTYAPQWVRAGHAVLGRISRSLHHFHY